VTVLLESIDLRRYSFVLTTNCSITGIKLKYLLCWQIAYYAVYYASVLLLVYFLAYSGDLFEFIYIAIYSTETCISKLAFRATDSSVAEC